MFNWLLLVGTDGIPDTVPQNYNPVNLSNALDSIMTFAIGFFVGILCYYVISKLIKNNENDNDNNKPKSE